MTHPKAILEIPAPFGQHGIELHMTLTLSMILTLLCKSFQKSFVGVHKWYALTCDLPISSQIPYPHCHLARN